MSWPDLRIDHAMKWWYFMKRKISAAHIVICSGQINEQSVLDEMNS